MNNPYRRPFRDRLVLAKILQTDFQDPTNGINAFGRVGRERVQESIKKLPKRPKVLRRSRKR